MELIVACDTCIYKDKRFRMNTICKKCSWDSSDNEFYIKELRKKFPKNKKNFNYKNYIPNNDFIKEAINLEEFIKEEEFMI